MISRGIILTQEYFGGDITKLFANKTLVMGFSYDIRNQNVKPDGDHLPAKGIATLNDFHGNTWCY